MSKFNTHPADKRLKNQRDYTPKNRRPTLKQNQEQQRLKKLRKKRKKGKA